MVTVIHVTPFEAAASLATSTSVSSEAADSIINNDTTAAQINTESQTQKHNRPRRTIRVQHPSSPVEKNQEKRELKAVASNSSNSKPKKKRQKRKKLIIDLSGVPQQPPIPRPEEGTSKYTGVSYDKWKNKWRAQIHIDGKMRHIGYYKDEEEAGVDFARAFFKYRD